MSGIQWNEISSKSFGGTELMARRIETGLPKELLDEVQIIPSRVRELEEDKIRILYCHDLPGDPESHHLKDGGWRKFHKIVFVSQWQKEWYVREYQIPFSHVVVLQNAINPIPEFTKPDPKEKINIIYHTTPHRGLDVLYTVVDALAKEHPEIHLDVYSSFKIYGWEQRDEAFHELFDRISNHKNMSYYGFVSNDDIRTALQNAHIFAYPNTWMETSCLSLMEAMSAECDCVHPDFGALPETAANWTTMYSFHEDKTKHAMLHYSALNASIKTLKAGGEGRAMLLRGAKNYADLFYNWDVRKKQWEKLISNLIEEVKDRSIQKEDAVFSYRSF